MDTEARYGIYLLFDRATDSSLSILCDDAAAAGGASPRRLPVHVTAKGFFASTVSDAELADAFARLPDLSEPVLRIGPIVAYGDESVAMQVGRDEAGREISKSLMHWHLVVLDTFLPFVRSDCELTSEWYGDRWDPHITIASHGISTADIGNLVRRVAARNTLTTVTCERAALVRATSNDWRTWWVDVTVEPISNRPVGVGH